MSFNSIDFFLFFIATFVVHWILKNKSSSPQNIFLLIVSYLFYGIWDMRFIPLLMGISVFNYYIGIQIKKNNVNVKPYLIIGILVNLFTLLIFKYFNFFIESFITVFARNSDFQHFNTLEIILPLGLSFFSLQCIGYLIDVYQNKVSPSRDIVKFSLFVAFFPQLVAGPIERASNLLPQLNQPRTFRYKLSMDGLYFVLWGFFKKLVIADNCALIANATFSDSEGYSGFALFIGAIAFGIQIYCDFSGYSDIAIGCAKMLGIELRTNFSYPYFSKNIKTFWRKWHISLSTWFRDYLYIPLGGKNNSKIKHALVVLLVFTVSGLWHGASMNFVFWGLFHSIIYIVFSNFNYQFFNQNKFTKQLSKYITIVLTFTIIQIAWIYFRSESFQQANEYIYHMFRNIFYSIESNYFLDLLKHEFGIVLSIILVFFIFIEWIGRKYLNPLLILNNYPRWIKYSIFYLIIIVIFLFNGNEQKFIYFQF